MSQLSEEIDEKSSKSDKVDEGILRTLKYFFVLKKSTSLSINAEALLFLMFFVFIAAQISSLASPLDQSDNSIAT